MNDRTKRAMWFAVAMVFIAILMTIADTARSAEVSAPVFPEKISGGEAVSSAARNERVAMRSACPTQVLPSIQTERKPAHVKAIDNRYKQAPSNLWKGIIGEAVGEGYDGMYAVACVYRNRLAKGLPLGCVALKRKDLDTFVKKQGVKYELLAKRIVDGVFDLSDNNSKPNDPTRGATHYENLVDFPMPRWAGNMRITAVIGKHTFFK